MITKRMWANMLGHAAYQIAVVMVLLFSGPDPLLPDPRRVQPQLRLLQRRRRKELRRQLRGILD